MPNKNTATFTIKAAAQSIGNSYYRYHYLYKFYMVGSTEPAFALSSVVDTADNVNTTRNVETSSTFYRNCVCKAQTLLTQSEWEYNEDEPILASTVTTSSVNDIQAPNYTTTASFTTNQARLYSALSQMRRDIGGQSLFDWLKATNDFDITFKDASNNTITGMSLVYDNEHDQCMVEYMGNHAGNIQMIIAPSAQAGSHFTSGTVTFTLEAASVNPPVVTVDNTEVA